MLEWWDSVVAGFAQPCKCDQLDEPDEEFMIYMSSSKQTFLSENSTDSIEVEYEDEGSSSRKKDSVLYWCHSQLDMIDHPKDMTSLFDLSQRSMKSTKIQSHQAADADACPCLSITSDIDDEEANSVLNEAETEIYSNILSIEDDEYITTSPLILSNKQMIEIQSRGLPARMNMKTWCRLYSLNRDGSCFETMINSTKGSKESLIVMKTDIGDILGGFVDSGWFKQKNIGFFLTQSWKFYGGGESFVFCNNPLKNKNNEGQNSSEEKIDPHDNNNMINELCIYPWSSKNDFIQACDMRNGRMGMGGGHEFAWIVQDNFSIGMTGPSATFDSPPLVSSKKKRQIQHS